MCRLCEEFNSADGAVAAGTDREQIIEMFDARAMKKFGSTQVEISSDSAAGQALEKARSYVADKDLAGKGKDVGGSHVTVRYGALGEDHEPLRVFLSRQEPFEAYLGTTAVFDPSDSSEGTAVIIAPVIGGDLHFLNKAVERHGTFAPSSFPDYRPHATIAYVKPETAKRYVGMEVTRGQRFVVDSVTISKRDGTALSVKLTGKPEPQEGYVPQGIGYAPVGGQSFPESAGLKLLTGPQGEPIFKRYSDDQPRDPDGKFASGGGDSKDKEEGGSKEGGAAKEDAGRKDFSGAVTMPGGQVLNLSADRATKEQQLREFAKSESDKLPADVRTALENGGHTSDVYKDKTTGLYDAKRQEEVHDPIVSAALRDNVSQAAPSVVFVGGGPAAGKSTASDEAGRSLGGNFVDINVDNVREGLPEFTSGLPSNLMGMNDEAGDIRDRIIDNARDLRYNMVIDGVGSASTADNLQKLADEGYQISYVYVHRDVEDAEQRAADRPFLTSNVADMRILPTTGYGPNKDKSMVWQYHDKARSAFDKLAGISHEVKVIDKSRGGPKKGRVVYWRVGDKIKFKDVEAIRRIENSGRKIKIG